MPRIERATDPTNPIFSVYPGYFFSFFVPGLLISVYPGYSFSVYPGYFSVYPGYFSVYPGYFFSLLDSQLFLQGADWKSNQTTNHEEVA